MGIVGPVWPAGASGQAPPAKPAQAQPPAPASARSAAESLKFAKGLFHDRNYGQAADELERFLKQAKPGPDANEARFLLANSRLFQGRLAEARLKFEEF